MVGPSNASTDESPEPCDRADIVMQRAVNCGWITVHDKKQFLANLRIALDTEVRAGGPYLDNGWNRAND